MSYPGCCSGASSCSLQSSLSIRETTKIYRSLDVVMSSYSNISPGVSALEAAAVQEYKPLFIDTGAPLQISNQRNNLNDYRKSMDVDYAIRYMVYAGQKNNAGYTEHIHAKPDVFSPDIFLDKNRPVSQFIGSVDDIKHYIRDAFEKTAGKKLPEDVMIRVVEQHDLKELHEEFGGTWSPGIQGISINKKGFGQSMIFCKENELDRLIVTIGHELGHIINFPLADKLNEEAKAFAFEMAWVNALHKHNIAGLRRSINPDPMPARNGLHDVAFSFVKNLIKQGRDCFEIIKELMSNKLKVRGGEDVLL